MAGWDRRRVVLRTFSLWPIRAGRRGCCSFASYTKAAYSPQLLKQWPSTVGDRCNVGRLNSKQLVSAMKWTSLISRPVLPTGPDGSVISIHPQKSSISPPSTPTASIRVSPTRTWPSNRPGPSRCKESLGSNPAAPWPAINRQRATGGASSQATASREPRRGARRRRSTGRARAKPSLGRVVRGSIRSMGHSPTAKEGLGGWDPTRLAPLNPPGHNAQGGSPDWNHWLLGRPPAAQGPLRDKSKYSAGEINAIDRLGRKVGYPGRTGRPIWGGCAGPCRVASC